MDHYLFFQQTRQLNVWNLEISDRCFNIMKPSNREDLTEVITASEFHPIHCNLLAYSSSRGSIQLVDLWQLAVFDHKARILQHGESSGLKSFWQKFSSILDFKLASDKKTSEFSPYSTTDACMAVCLRSLQAFIQEMLRGQQNEVWLLGENGCDIQQWGQGWRMSNSGRRCNHMETFSWCL